MLTRSNFLWFIRKSYCAKKADWVIIIQNLQHMTFKIMSKHMSVSAMMKFLPSEYLISKQNREQSFVWNHSSSFLVHLLIYFVVFLHSDIFPIYFHLMSIVRSQVFLVHSFYLDSKSCQIFKLEVRFKKNSDEKLRSQRRIFISLLVDIICFFIL